MLACQGCQAPGPADQPLLMFPAPPAAPRIQFLTWASGSEEVAPAQDAFEAFVLGDDPAKTSRISKPYGVAARDGVVYICDTKGLSLCRLDFKNHSYTILGDRGPGRLLKPINIIIDPLGFKFVADPVRKQIVVFDDQDRYVTAYDIPKPCRPVDVALHGNELYVLDNDDTCQIVVLDRASGQVLRTFGELGEEPGQFRIPNSLAISPDGFLYVSDTHNFRIQKLTLEGESVWVKGTPGYRIGQFGRPRGLRVGPDGIIYVVDGATELIQMYDSDGNTLMRFAGPGEIPGGLVLPSTLALDATSVAVFQEYAHPKFKIEYIVIVANQYGRYLVNVYAFGAFPEGFTLTESQVNSLPPLTTQPNWVSPQEIEDSSAESPENDESSPEAQSTQPVSPNDQPRDD